MTRKGKKTAKKLENLQSSMGPPASGSNQGQVNGNITTTENVAGTASQDEGNEAVFTRKTKQNRKRNAKRNAKKSNDTKDGDDSEDDKLAATAKIISKKNTIVNGQATEQDGLSGKAPEESQDGIIQSVRKLLSKKSSVDDSQATQDSTVDKKDDEASEKTKLQAIMKILGQESARAQGKDQVKKPVPDGNTTKHDQPHDGSKPKNKAKSTSSEPTQGKGITMASQFEPPPPPNDLPGQFPSTHHKLDLVPSADDSQSKESAEKTRISLDIVCGGPCHPCSQTATKLLARIAELESKRKALLADYGDTTASDHLNDANMMARVQKKAKAHGKPKGGFPEDDEEEDPVIKRLAQIEEQVKVIDEIIEASKLELKTSQLECNARRLDTYVHEQQVKFLHIHGATPHWIVPDKYKEHKEVMETLREEAEQYWEEAAEAQGKAKTPHEGPCPCGQTVLGYLLYAIMALLALSLVASFLDH